MLISRSERPKIKPKNFQRMKESITVISSARDEDLKPDSSLIIHNFSYPKMEALAVYKLVPDHFFFKDRWLDLLLVGLSDAFQDRQMIVIRPMMYYRQKED